MDDLPFELSPPHGDDTMDFYYWGIVNLFSSPYGDCTDDDAIIMVEKLFSPLTGIVQTLTFWK